jgi:hypothetical protein
MKYTAVFEWPDGEEPRIKKGDSWLGGKLVSVEFDSDALSERTRLADALIPFAEGYGSEEYRENAIKLLLDGGFIERHPDD